MSYETLLRVTHNDPSLTKLRLVGCNIYGYDRIEFYSDNSGDYSTLGSAIANNTHLETLVVILSDDVPLTVADRGFYDGLKRNSSISELSLYCNTTRNDIAGGVGQEILEACQENNNQLTFLSISNANLHNGGDSATNIGDTLRTCRNLQKVVLNNCNITDAQLLPIVDAVREHRMLEELTLYDNNIGNVSCEAIATLLADPNSNLRILHLGNNTINNEGATAIATSLTNNNQLHTLYLHGNPIGQTIIQDVFSNILCNVSNRNSLYASNHTLRTLNLGGYRHGQHLASLLKLNKDTNKSHIAIKKILKYHPNMDMGPLFE